jgi:hypothetical protein
MMRMFWILACAVPLAAQSKIDFDFGPLAARARDSVEVNLDGRLLEMASRFLSTGNEEEREVKRLLSSLRGVYVRSYKFSKPGEYSLQDVEALRSNVKGKEWVKFVDVRSGSAGGENAGVYVNTDGSEVRGIIVIAAKAQELTVVNILGNINVDELRTLGGKLGIPKLDLPSGAVKGFTSDPKSKKDDDE